MMLDKVAKAEYFVVGIVEDVDSRVADVMCGCVQLLRGRFIWYRQRL